MTCSFSFQHTCLKLLQKIVSYVCIAHNLSKPENKKINTVKKTFLCKIEKANSDFILLFRFLSVFILCSVCTFKKEDLASFEYTIYPTTLYRKLLVILIGQVHCKCLSNCIYSLYSLLPLS